MADRIRSWQCPGSDSPESYKIGWIDESCQDGEAWHKQQRGYRDWKAGLDILAGDYSQREIQEGRSRLTGNRLKINIQTVVAGLSAIRPWGGYQSAEAYKKFALFMNMTTRALYLKNFWDQDIKSALQWASVTNQGFMRPVYRRSMAGMGTGSIELDTFGSPSVLPVQMPANGDYQRAYAVTLMDEKPIYEAHGMFPDHQDRLKPTSSRYWYSRDINTAAKQNIGRRGYFNPFKGRNESSNLATNLIPLRYTTINDLSINATGKTIPMGSPGSPWYYEVPSYGADMPGDKKANELDARMYPNRRLIISSENVVLYDGPAFNWHGQLDLIPFCLDRYPWEPGGFSLIHDGYLLQTSLDELDRGVMDKLNADMDRPLAYNMNAVSRKEANQVDLMQPRQRIAFDGDAVDKPFTQIAPDDVYRVSAETLAYRKELQADLDYILQTRDVVELGKARALGKGQDQLEALISANGPRVKDMSRAIEKSVCGLADQVKYLVLQYMTTAELIPYVTEAGINEVFDYSPESLIPSHLPGENPVNPITQEQLASPTEKIQRAKWMAQNLPFTMTPHSIHEIHQMTYRLMLMQLRQRGYHIAECDILEANDIPEVKRAKGSSTQERFWAEKEDELEETVKIAKAAQGLGIDPAALMGGGSSGGKKPEGRPPTGQSAPTLQQKGDGRPVVSESS